MPLPLSLNETAAVPKLIHVARSSCGYSEHTRRHAIVFRIGMFPPGVRVTWQSAGFGILVRHGGKPVNVDGRSGLSIRTGWQDNVVFAKGQVAVSVIGVRVKASAALAIARYIGKRV
jgi:hypothetical protein